MLKLYDYYRSSACFRVRIALHHKELEYEKIPIHLLNHGGEQYSETYYKINPQQLVPALQDGHKIITQSFAIIEYLEEAFPSPALLPRNAYEKALIRSFALAIAADIHPLNNLRVLNYLSRELGMSDEQKTKWYHHWISKGLTALENLLIQHKTAGIYCFGDQFSLADLYLVPQMYNARRFSCDISPYPTLSRIDANCQKHPAVIKAWPLESVPA